MECVYLLAILSMSFVNVILSEGSGWRWWDSSQSLPWACRSAQGNKI